MAESIRDVMTTDPQTIDAGETLVAAAKAMKDRDVGALVVTEQGSVTAIVTDRDIVIRGVAEEADTQTARVGDVASRELTALSPDDTVEDAIRAMREQDVRRLPVVEDDRAVGIVSLGDLAVDRDPESVLADISAAPPQE
jgi:CBS domain-containing protein